MKWFARKMMHLSEKNAHRIALVLGWLLWIFGIRRSVIFNNLKRVYPYMDDLEKKRIAKAVYRQLGMRFVEAMRLPLMNKARAFSLLGNDFVERLNQLRQDRGVLVFVAHFGAWDVLSAATSQAGLPLYVITRKIKNRMIESYYREIRNALGIQLLEAKGSAIAIYRALHAKGIIAFAIDQHAPDGIYTHFMGQRAKTSDSLARIALSTEAPVVGVFLRASSDGYDLESIGPIETSGRSVEELTQCFDDLLADQIQQHPEQWFWVHRRWKP